MTHNYTLVAEGKKLDKVFLTRSEAVKHMYNIINDLNLNIKEVWEDRHDVTYICNNNIKFHINRYM